MASMTTIICKCGCGREKLVRSADIKRGWGKYYSKSCKAKVQERRTHQNRKYLKRKKFAHYQEKFGGIPQFEPHSGEYIGFCPLPGDVSESQD